MKQIGTQSIEIDGSSLKATLVSEVAGATSVSVKLAADVAPKMNAAAATVQTAVDNNQLIYGVTTGFGGMAGVPVSPEFSASSQENLLSFLAAGCGDELDHRHVRAAMLLRANVLAQGCSGVRLEIVERLLQFVSADATPVVRELGSIGASGDLVPLSVIGRAITGTSEFVRVRLGQQLLNGKQILSALDLKPISLKAKEGLAIVNGTSFSSAVAANTVVECRRLMAVTYAVNAMMLQALQVHEEPFDEFVHQKKPHPGQIWSAKILRSLLQEGRNYNAEKPPHVQDRYSVRCFPQYIGAVAEGLARIIETVEIEMNSVSDNPLVDVEQGRLCQSGNFLGQFLAIAMDDLRKLNGLMAKHLDVQIATLVAPEFNNGLPASLRGNESVAYNMGLKGLQITGNSIMPLLTWYGNPITENFPTHAEQFNQNVNGLSWGSANLAWKSTSLYRRYLSVAAIFAIQALDLRARSTAGHCDGRALLGTTLTDFYESICEAAQIPPTNQTPFLYDDKDIWLEQIVERIESDLGRNGNTASSVNSVLHSFDEHFGC